MIVLTFFFPKGDDLIATEVRLGTRRRAYVPPGLERLGVTR